MLQKSSSHRLAVKQGSFLGKITRKRWGCSLSHQNFYVDGLQLKFQSFSVDDSSQFFCRFNFNFVLDWTRGLRLIRCRRTSWSQITIDSHNGKLVWWEAEKKKEEFYYTLLEKARHSVKIDPELKKALTPSLDSKPACPDRMQLLYHMCHHHCHTDYPIITIHSLIYCWLILGMSFVPTRA